MINLENSTTAAIPDISQFQHWCEQVIPTEPPRDINIRIMNQEEMIAINSNYRGKAKPTNVLSFQAETIPGFDTDSWGDIAICAEVMQREITEGGLIKDEHWAHIVIHACLHLLGYDHENAEDAKIMEEIEIRALAQIGIENPYEDGPNDQ